MKWAALLALLVCLASTLLAAGAWGWYHSHTADHATGSWFAFLAAGLAIVAGVVFYIADRVHELETNRR